MARFYGTVQGGRGEASRLGHQYLNVSAQSWQGIIKVQLCRTNVAGIVDPKGEVDSVTIYAAENGGQGRSVQLYCGPIHDLFDKTIRQVQLAMLAGEVLGGK